MDVVDCMSEGGMRRNAHGAAKVLLAERGRRMGSMSCRSSLAQRYAVRTSVACHMDKSAKKKKGCRDQVVNALLDARSGNRPMAMIMPSGY